MTDESVGISAADTRAPHSQYLRAFRADALAEPIILGSIVAPRPCWFRSIGTARCSAASDPNPIDHRCWSFYRRVDPWSNGWARSSRITSVRVFGSVARETETGDSDIDLFVEPADHAGLFDLAQFGPDMEQLTERSVDVVSRRSLDPEVDAAILAEAVVL